MSLVNRVVLAVLGACLLAAGVLGLLATWDVVGDDSIDSVIPFRDVWDWWTGIDSTDAALWALLGAAALLFLIALAVLVRQVWIGHPLGGERLVLESADRGRTAVRRRAIERACARQAEHHPGVEEASAYDLKLGAEGAARLRLRLRIEAAAAVPAVGIGVVDDVAATLGEALGRPPADVTAIVEIARPGRAGRTRRVG